MSFSAELFDNLTPSSFGNEKLNIKEAVPHNDNSGLSVDSVFPENEIKTRGRGRPRTGKMDRVMCYFPKELIEDMNHFSEKEMVSRNSFIITCILKHVKELKKEEKKGN